MPEKFTQAIKDNWLEDLKSGNNRQGFCALYHQGDNSFCCIGRLGAITEGLSHKPEEDEENPYIFLESTIGDKLMEKLFLVNDRGLHDPDYARDYSNVIPLIEKLPVQD
jgi:hypothetical protein